MKRRPPFEIFQIPGSHLRAFFDPSGKMRLVIEGGDGEGEGEGEGGGLPEGMPAGGPGSAENKPEGSKEGEGEPKKTEPEKGKEGKEGEPQKMEDLPEWAQKEIKRGRDDAAKFRNEMKELKESQDAFRKGLLKLAGGEEGEGEGKKPEEVVAEMEKKFEDLQEKLAASRIREKVIVEAGKQKAKVKLLMAFLKDEGSLKDLDADADDLESKITKIVQAAIEEEPNLRETGGTPTRGGTDLNGGGSSESRPTSTKEALEKKYAGTLT